MEKQLTTVMEYAKQSGITAQAAGQTIKRYEKELKKHITKQGNTRYLDEYAVEFLKKHRRASPVVVYDRDMIKELDEARETHRQALIELTAMQKTVIELQKANAGLIAENNELKLLLEAKNTPQDAPQATQTNETPTGGQSQHEQPKTPQEATGHTTGADGNNMTFWQRVRFIFTGKGTT